jgi:HlyD family secretion protein
VDEADIGKVKSGQEVLFTVDAYPDKIFQGTVSQVRFAPKEQQNVITYATIIEVPNPELMLRPGMTASVSIIAEKKQQVVRVANAALRFKPDSEDTDLSAYAKKDDSEPASPDSGLVSRQRLWLLDSNKKVKTAPVKTGIFDNKFTEIVEGEISEGDTVIIGYLPQWHQAAAKKSSFFRFGARQ